MKDTKENRKIILTDFLETYVDNSNFDKAATDKLKNYTDDEFIDSMGRTIALKIKIKKEIAESLIFKAFTFLFASLNKVTKSADGKIVVSKENTIRNFSDEELEFFLWASDELIKFIQFSVSISGLSEKEQNDFDEDCVSFVERITIAESLVFDDSLSQTDYKSYQFK